MSDQQSKPEGKNTPIVFEGSTRERECGGNTAPTTSTEEHDSPRAKGKRVQVPSSPSKCVTASDSTLDDSKVTGTTRREPSEPAKVRTKNNAHRDAITNLGKGKSSSVILGD